MSFNGCDMARAQFSRAGQRKVEIEPNDRTS